MVGNSNSGNRTKRRGVQPTRRIRLVEENYRRLHLIAPSKDDAETLVNLIVRKWLDVQEPPAKPS